MMNLLGGALNYLRSGIIFLDIHFLRINMINITIKSSFHQSFALPYKNLGGEMIKINNKTPIPIIDLVKLYFSKHSTIDFTKIKQMTKKFKEDINRYSNPTVPSWLEGRAKDISLKTFSFIKNNKYLLSPSKQFFTYQEYQQLLKFKPALENINNLIKEKNKVDLASKETGKNITRIVITSIIILFTFVLFREQIYQQLYIWNKDGLITILGGIMSLIVLLYITSNIVSIFLGFIISCILLSGVPSQNLSYFYDSTIDHIEFFTYYIIILSIALITYKIA